MRGSVQERPSVRRRWDRSLIVSFLLRSFMEIYLPMRKFFHNLIHPEYSAVTDVYVLMFLADTVDFIIIVFGFWAFGVGRTIKWWLTSPSDWRVDTLVLLSSRNIQQQTSRRPSQRIRCPDLSWSWFWSSSGPWWWTAPSISGSPSWARSFSRSSCYLASTSGCSSFFQESQTSKCIRISHPLSFILCNGVSILHFNKVSRPFPSHRRFSENIVAQMWYFVKCIYFGLSAYQIRCGYPTRVLGNFLTKSYNYVNLFLFQGWVVLGKGHVTQMATQGQVIGQG